MEEQNIGGLSLDNLASRLHQVYQEEIRRQGKKSKHSDFFTELPKDIADLDRALAKYVLRLLKERDDEWRLNIKDRKDFIESAMPTDKDIRDMCDMYQKTNDTNLDEDMVYNDGLNDMLWFIKNNIKYDISTNKIWNT